MPFPKPLSPSDALAVFHAELARAAVSPQPAAAGQALWPRFAGYYQGPARLPRKARRALQRRWRRSLGGLALLCALGQTPALAATINVGGACTLIRAVTAANNDTATGGCSAGSGADTIALNPFGPSFPPPLTTVNNSTYGPTGLPVITSEITIQGSTSFFGTISRDSSAPAFRILAVGATGNLTLQGIRVSGGASLFDPGGDIYNAGTLTLTNTTVSDNTGGYGGGISSSGTLTLSDSRVSGNTANDGGGIRNDGILTLTSSTVSDNRR
ncbi:MAG: hypothetical protein ACREU8_06635 [Gammaproteobacteria bacterium]